MFAAALNKGIRGATALLVVLFSVCAILIFFAHHSPESHHYPNLFYNFFTSRLSERWVIVSINLGVVALSTFMISLITARQEIVDKQNYFPVFIYMLINLTALSPTQVTPQAISNVFILYSIYRLLDIYRTDNALNEIFSAAFWLSACAFITISSITAIPLFFIVLLILRPFYWREWVIAILGFSAPVILYESVAYLSDFTQGYFIKAARLFFENLRLPSFSEYYLPFCTILFILFVISLVQALVNGFGNTVKKQRAKAILLWFVFFSLPGFFSGGANASSIILTFSLPLSFFTGDLLFSLRQQKIANTLLALLLLSAAVVFLAGYELI